MEWLVFLAGLLIGTGVFRWGFYRGRQWERAVGPPPVEITKIVPRYVERPPAKPFGPQYIVDDKGRLFQVDRVPVAKQISGPSTYWKCTICGDRVPSDWLWCRNCGAIPPEVPEMYK